MQGLYAASEHLVYRYARANRFYMVKTAPYERYDYVILGASHAAAFDLEDMNARLEAMTKSRILNLSTTGGGITINRLLLEYFLVGHQTSTVVYVVDSFVFNSRQWNEDRLQDARLFYRAPFDLSLVRLLLQEPVSRSVVLDYVSGFSKINNPDRFVPDIPEFAARFDKTYRPVKQIDQQRIDYLYPRQNDEQATELHYMAEFEVSDTVHESAQHPRHRHQAADPRTFLPYAPERGAVRRDAQRNFGSPRRRVR